MARRAAFSSAEEEIGSGVRTVNMRRCRLDTVPVPGPSIVTCVP
jgi:hypothetical protein